MASRPFSLLIKRENGVYFAARLAAFSARCFLYFLSNLSTRPAVSISFCLPVKNGWQLEQISTRMSFCSWYGSGTMSARADHVDLIVGRMDSRFHRITSGNFLWEISSYHGARCLGPASAEQFSDVGAVFHEGWAFAASSAGNTSVDHGPHFARGNQRPHNLVKPALRWRP